MTNSEKIKQYIEDIKKDSSVLEQQIDTANEAIRFVDVKGGQWEGEFGEKYGEDRVKMQFDITSDAVHDFVNEWNQNRVGVEFKPDDDTTTDDDAEIINGAYRADFRDNDGKLSTDQAVDEIAKCGYGCFGLTTVFEDEEDPENELQRIGFFPIHNAFNHVIWDENAKRIDKKDAMRCTLISEVSVDEFERKYPDKKVESAYTPIDRRYHSVNVDQRNTVFIAKRYEIKQENVFIYIYHNLQTGEVETFNEKEHFTKATEISKNPYLKLSRKKKIKRKSVYVSTFTGSEFLEPPRRIVGKWIPIVAGYAYRSYVDGEEQFHGLVQKKMDAQRLFNMLMNKIAESSASSGERVPIFAPEQVNNDSIKASWANKINAAYRLLMPLKDKDGNVLQAGPLGYDEPPQLDQNTGVLLEQVLNFMQRGRGPKEEVFDKEMSGKAINSLIKRLNMATGEIQDNIANMVQHAGLVYKDMFLEVYDSPRELNTLSKDGTEGRVQLFKTEFDKKKQQFQQVNKLSKNKFKVYSDIGPQYESLREGTVESLRDVLELLSKVKGGEQFIPATLATMLENIQGEGLTPLKKLVREFMLKQGLVKPESDEENALVEQAQQPQEDPAQALIEATATRETAEAKNLEASSLDKIASAEKKTAETQQIYSDIDVSKTDSLMRIRQQALGQANSL